MKPSSATGSLSVEFVSFWHVRVVNNPAVSRINPCAIIN